MNAMESLDWASSKLTLSSETVMLESDEAAWQTLIISLTILYITRTRQASHKLSSKTYEW